jgi:hypothetical protein
VSRRSIYRIYLVEDPGALGTRGKILRVRAFSSKIARRFAEVAFPQLTVQSLRKEIATSATHCDPLTGPLDRAN